ncbi:MAG: hypothetical protein L0H59_12605 [Tomitella sp.]|nr:hypothetical protein [Tomitella sp.]
MGSIGMQREREMTSAQQTRAYLEENLWPGYTVMQAADRSTGSGPYGEWRRVLYAAVDDGAGNTTAHVLLYNAPGDGELYIKALHEEMGPAQYEDVPAKLLDALTPTASGSANEWRQAARDWRTRSSEGRKRARAALGRMITLAHPVRFGDPVGLVTRVHVESATRWQDPATGMRLKAPAGWHMYAFTIDSAVDAAA